MVMCVRRIDEPTATATAAAIAAAAAARAGIVHTRSEDFPHATTINNSLGSRAVAAKSTSTKNPWCWTKKRASTSADTTTNQKRR